MVAGSFAPEDGSANPRLLSPALAGAARAAGAAIREQAEVVDHAHDGARFVLRTKDGVTFAGPVLLVRGELDDSVDPMSLDVIAENLGGPVVRLTLPGSGHVATFGPDIPQLTAAILELL